MSIPAPRITPTAPNITVTAHGNKLNGDRAAINVDLQIPLSPTIIPIRSMQFSWREHPALKIKQSAGEPAELQSLPWRDLDRVPLRAGTTQLTEENGIPFGRHIQVRARLISVAGGDSPWTVAPVVEWSVYVPSFKIVHLEQPLSCRLANKVSRGSEHSWYATIGEGLPPLDPETGVVETLGRGYRGQFSWRWGVLADGQRLDEARAQAGGVEGALVRWRVEVYAGELEYGTWGSLLDEANAGTMPSIVQMRRTRAGGAVIDPETEGLPLPTVYGTDTWNGLVMVHEYEENPFGQYGNGTGYTLHLERNIRAMQELNQVWGTGAGNAEIESPGRIFGIRVGIITANGAQVGGPPDNTEWSPISWQVNDWPSLNRGLSPLFTSDATLQFAGTSFHDWAAFKNPRPTNTWYLRVLGVQGSDPCPGDTFGDAIPIYVGDPVFGTPNPVNTNGFGDYSENDCGEADYSGGLFVVQVSSVEFHAKYSFKRHAPDPVDRVPGRFPAGEYLTASASADYGLCLADELSWDWNGPMISGEPELIKWYELKRRTGSAFTIVNPSTVGGISLPS